MISWSRREIKPALHINGFHICGVNQPTTNQKYLWKIFQKFQKTKLELHYVYTDTFRIYVTLDILSKLEMI